MARSIRMVPAVSIQLLGRFSVSVEGVPISGDAWRSRRAADIVKLLALAPERRLHRTQAMETLWPNSDPEASGANLRKALHFARLATGDDRVITNESGVLVLWPDQQIEIDAERFETAALRALDDGGGDRCQDAADLYPGHLLPDDRYEEWSEEPRVRIRRRYREVLRAGALWDRLTDEDPTDEQAARALMRAHLDAGERREAIRRFERLREALRDQLGVGPDSSTVALYEEVLALEGAPTPTEAERAHALLAWALVHMTRQELVEAERAAEQVRALALDANLAREFAEATEILAKCAMMQGRWRERFSQEFAEAIRTRAGDEPIIYEANLCLIEYYLTGPDGYDVAVDFARSMVELAESSGSGTGVAMAMLMLGEAELLAGDPDQAEQHLATAVEANDREGSMAGAALARQRLAEAAVGRGRRYDARRLLDRARTLALRSDLVGHVLVRVFGTMIQAAADPNKAMAILRQSENELRRLRLCEPCSMGYLTSAAMASARAGELGKARAFIGVAERVAGMWQGGLWVAAVWEARGVLREAEGETEQARAMFREASEAFARTGNHADAERCRTAATLDEAHAPARGVVRH